MRQVDVLLPHSSVQPPEPQNVQSLFNLSKASSSNKDMLNSSRSNFLFPMNAIATMPNAKKQKTQHGNKLEGHNSSLSLTIPVVKETKESEFQVKVDIITQRTHQNRSQLKPSTYPPRHEPRFKFLHKYTYQTFDRNIENPIQRIVT